jgi:hypothetical protein
MTSIVSIKRSSIETGQSVPDANNAFTTASQSGFATIPNTPGPDDDYRMYFPQSNAVWADIALIYTDINNTPDGGIRPAASGPLRGPERLTE